MASEADFDGTDSVVGLSCKRLFQKVKLCTKKKSETELTVSGLKEKAQNTQEIKENAFLSVY